MYRYKDALERLKHTPLLYILECQHGNRYVLVKSVEELHNFAISVVEQRNEDGYYADITENIDSPVLPIGDEVFKSLPEGKTKDFAREQLAEYEKAVKAYEEHYFIQKDFQKMLTTRNGREAYTFLAYRADGEYEGIKTEKPERFETKI